MIGSDDVQPILDVRGDRIRHDDDHEYLDARGDRVRNDDALTPEETEHVREVFAALAPAVVLDEPVPLTVPALTETEADNLLHAVLDGDE